MRRTSTPRGGSRKGEQTMINDGKNQDRITPAPSPPAEMIEIENARDESTINAKLAALIVAGMFFGVFNHISIIVVSLDFFYLQIFFCFYVGYRWHPRLALMAGVLVFLPNLVLHIVGSFIDVEAAIMGYPVEFTGDLFSGRMSFFENLFSSRTLFIAYLYYAPFGYAVAAIKSMLAKRMETEPFLSPRKMSYRKNLSFLHTAGIFFLSTVFSVGPLTVDLIYALLPIFSLWIYRYGFDQAKYLFGALIIVQIVSTEFGMLNIFNSIGYVNLTLLALLLLAYSHLKIESRKIDNIGSFVLTLMAICFLTGFSFRMSYDFALQSIALALPALYFLGYISHSRAGMLGGVIIGLAMIIRFHASEMIVWGGPDIQFILAAPLIGYLGGIDFSKKHFLNSGLKILGIYYAVILLARVTNYGFRVERNLDDLVNMGASIILLLVLSIRAKQPPRMNSR
jgi:hypothetical protein